jgi:hypothetical protein
MVVADCRPIRFPPGDGAMIAADAVVVTESLARSRPEVVAEVYRLLAQAKQAAGLPKAGSFDFLLFGFGGLAAGVEHDR